MTRIVATLESHDDVGLLRQPVNDLAFPFVAPLSADDDNISHSRVFPLQLPKHERDRSRKTGVQFRIMHPAQMTAGAARMRGTQPDKGSGLSTQAKRGFCRVRNGVQAFDIP